MSAKEVNDARSTAACSISDKMGIDIQVVAPAPFSQCYYSHRS